MTKMQSDIFFRINNTNKKILTSVDLDSPTDLAGIAKKISFRLRAIQPHGTLVLYNLSHGIARYLALGGWHAGWQIAFLPSHISEKNKQLSLNKLAANLIVYQNWDDLDLSCVDSPARFLCFDGDSETALINWLGERCDESTLNYPAYEWRNQEAALIVFTSGTTGEPKAVFHSLFAILMAAERFIKQFNISGQDRLLNTSMLHSIAGVRCSIIMPLLTGCTVNDLPISGGIFQILEVLEREQSTIMLTGPSAIRQLALVQDKIERLPDQLRAIICGGSPLDRECRTQLFQKFQIKILDGYGFTESGGAIVAEAENTYNPANPAMGRACHDIKLTVINAQGQEQDCGDGELRVYCSSIFLGYSGDRLDARLYFDTGDMVKLDRSGNVTWLFRLKNGIKTVSSEWIYAEAVEQWLRKNTVVTDVHVSGSVDRLGRPQFRAEIAGVAPENWPVWLDLNYKSLVLDLGRDYQVIDWHRVESIERSSFGKYQKAIY